MEFKNKVGEIFSINPEDVVVKRASN